MLCFKDMTFCSSDCTNEECGRHYGAEDRVAAEKWWGGPGAPVAFTDFSKHCDEYVAPVIGGWKHE